MQSYDCYGATIADATIHSVAASFVRKWPSCISVSDTGWGQPGIPGGYPGVTYVDGFLVRDQRVFVPECLDSNSPGTFLGLRSRTLTCPPGTKVMDTADGHQTKCGKQVCDPCLVAANPVSIGSGEKLQTAADISEGVSHVRYYRSFGESLPLSYASTDAKPGNSMFGANWRSEYATFLYPVAGSTAIAAVVTWADGSFQVYRPDGSPVLAMGNTNSSKLEVLASGYRLHKGGQMEVFDAAGNLLTITDTTGRTRTLSYDANGLLSTVTEDTGRKLTFSYGGNRVASVTDSAGSLYQYAYDGNNNLTTVTYPDNSVVQYLYDNVTFINALTGIIDENGVRFGTYTYDDQGRVKESKHAGDVDGFDFAYSGSTSITEPAGATRTYTQQTIAGVTKKRSVTQPPGSGSGVSESVTGYDVNGNVSSRRDFVSWYVTCYAYDLTRNLETKRVEGGYYSWPCDFLLSTPPAPGTVFPVRTISTQWHPDWRLEVRRAEPKKITTWVYNGQC